MDTVMSNEGKIVAKIKYKITIKNMRGGVITKIIEWDSSFNDLKEKDRSGLLLYSGRSFTRWTSLITGLSFDKDLNGHKLIGIELLQDEEGKR